MCATMGKEIDIQLAVDITGKELNVVRQKEVEGKNRWVVVDTIKPRKLTRDKVEEAMEAHMQLRDILMPLLKKINYEGQGLKDETELKEHFNIDHRYDEVHGHPGRARSVGRSRGAGRQRGKSREEVPEVRKADDLRRVRGRGEIPGQREICVLLKMPELRRGDPREYLLRRAGAWNLN